MSRKSRKTSDKIDKEFETLKMQEKELYEKYHELKVGDTVKISRFMVEDEDKADDLRVAKAIVGKHYKIHKIYEKEVSVYTPKNDKNSTCRTIAYHPAENVEKVL